jgi:two-component system, NarL family, sensor kinase
MKNTHLTLLAVWFLALVILIPWAVFLNLRLSLPTDGARLEPGERGLLDAGVTVSPLRDLPEGLQAGDVVLAAAGRSMEEWAQLLFVGGMERPGWEMDDQIPYTVLRAGEVQEIEVTLIPYTLGAAAAKNWGSMLYAPFFLLVGTFVFVRRPELPASRVLFLLSCCITSATTWSLGLQISDFIFPGGFWLYKLTTVVYYLLFFVTGFHFAAIFPRPLPLLQGRPWIVPGAYTAAALMVIGWTGVTYRLASSTLEWLEMWITIEGICAAVFLGLTLAAFLLQFRANRSGQYRQQIRWVVWAVLFSGGAGLLFYIFPIAVGRVSINPNFISFLILPFPLSIAISILKHNLFEIDRLINRTLVYGLLTLSVGGVYLAVVGLLGLIFHTYGNWYILLAANALAALLFQPLRIWLSRGVNRFMYGERDEPFEVLSRLGRRLAETVSLPAALPALAETVAQALKLPYVAIVLSGPTGFEPVTSFGKPTEEVDAYPISNQGEIVGQLLVGLRDVDEPFNEAEQRLLGSVASHAGPVIQSVLLNADLQRSRQRLVTAQAEERRRLRRDLHDGLGPTLASHLLKLGAARSQFKHNPALADRYLGELEQETEDLLAEVRRLVYDLRPPSLDQLGLLGALRACASQHNTLPSEPAHLQVVLSLPEKLPALPAAVEVAAYRIVQEALNNAVRHAQASRCEIRLACDQALHLSITDNGLGFQGNPKPGVGLASMRERATELGGVCQINSVSAGGLSIQVSLPLFQ